MAKIYISPADFWGNLYLMPGEKEMQEIRADIKEMERIAEARGASLHPKEHYVNPTGAGILDPIANSRPIVAGSIFPKGYVLGYKGHVAKDKETGLAKIVTE